MLKYPIDDETGCGCNVKLGVSLVLVNSSGQQGDIWAVDDRDEVDISEELKTQIEVSGRVAEVFGAQDLSRFSDIGVSEHLMEKDDPNIPGDEPSGCLAETKKI